MKRITIEAADMLDIWKSSYLITRQKIEDSGKGQRWEFDKNKLFAASDYMAKVCRDIYKFAMVSIPRFHVQSYVTIYSSFVDSESFQEHFWARVKSHS